MCDHVKGLVCDTDGSSVSFLSWAAGEPDFSILHDVCVELRRPGYGAKMENCENDNHVICQLGTVLRKSYLLLFEGMQICICTRRWLAVAG